MGTDGGKFDVSDRITADRLNRKTVLVDSGANIAALTPAPGQLAFCTFTGSGFAAGILYERNAANSVWVPISVDGTNAAQGDLIKHNGTSFVRFPKGSAYQVPRVNSGATDLEYDALKAESVDADFLAHIFRRGNFKVASVLAGVPSLWASAVTGTGSITHTYNTIANSTLLDTGINNSSTAVAIIPLSTGLILGAAFFSCSANAGSTVANQRFACGFYNVGDTPSNDNAAGFGFRIIDTGNFVAVNGNGTSSTTTDTGVANGLKNLLAIQTVTEIKFYIDGVLKATHTTNMPLLIARAFQVYITNTTAASRTAQIHGPVFLTA
jgi:hypothetical protein